MKLISSKLALPCGLGLLVSIAVLWASVVYTQAQVPFGTPTTPMAQRNALNLVFNQVNWFQNATRTASSYAGGGYGLLLQQFQAVRDQYNGLKSTLTPQPLNFGANPGAELESHLRITWQALTD